MSRKPYINIASTYHPFMTLGKRSNSVSLIWSCKSTTEVESNRGPTGTVSEQEQCLHGGGNDETVWLGEAERKISGNKLIKSTLQ